MSGVAAAGANPCTDSVATLSFDLFEDFEVSFDSPKLKKLKLDNLSIYSHDPFSGPSKKDFGLQVTLKVVEDTGARSSAYLDLAKAGRRRLLLWAAPQCPSATWWLSGACLAHIFSA